MSSIPSFSRKEVLTGWGVEIGGGSEGVEVDGEDVEGKGEERQEQRMSKRFSRNSVSSPEAGSRFR